MKKHISYPKITQFRNIVATINKSIKKPTLKFKGTVKLHLKRLIQC